MSGFLSPLLQETVQGRRFISMLLLMSDDYMYVYPFPFPCGNHRLISPPTCFSNRIYNNRRLSWLSSAPCAILDPVTMVAEESIQFKSQSSLAMVLLLHECLMASAGCSHQSSYPFSHRLWHIYWGKEKEGRTKQWIHACPESWWLARHLHTTC